MSVSYAREKYTDAVTGMATSSRSLQERLGDAFISGIIRVRPEEDLPPDLHDRHAELTSRLTSAEAAGDEGTVTATVSRMTTDEAEELARLVVNIWGELSATEE